MIKDYRRDIDSLRAISVLFVIFFHLNIPFFEGGFLGVDIFFVISGFLITKIILNDISENKFTLNKFYNRRIRRIIPLVLFVTFITTIIGYFVYFPNEFNEYVQNLLSVHLFFSNFWYSGKGGYFGPNLEIDPLIHFWSLSVEEQFYLIYPILLIFFFKKNLSKLFVFLLIFTIIFSFSISQFGGNLKFNYPYFENEFKFFSIPQFAFYSTLTRAWEILIGCMAAIYTNKNKWKFQYRNEFINMSFIFLIISLFLFNKDIPHPSLFTLIPIFFTLNILIFNNDSSTNNYILNSKFISSIGLISFSLYLWHQPIFSYVNLYTIKEPDNFIKIFLILLIFLISFFSWKFIEKPFRNPKLVNNKFLFISIFSFLVIIFISIIFFNSSNKNFDPKLLKILNEKSNYEKKYFDKCTTRPKKYIHPAKACIIGYKKNENVEIAIIGDSHLAALAYPLDLYLNDKKLNAYLLTANGCPTSMNLYNFSDNRFHCKKYYKDLINHIDNKKIKKIILHTRWGFYISGQRFNNEEGSIEFGKNSLFLRNEKDLLLNKSQQKK